MVQNWLKPSFRLWPADPVYIDERAIVSKQRFRLCTAMGAMVEAVVVGGVGEIREEGVMRKGERGRMYKRRKKTHR